jgi:hypothetical protein
MYLKRYTLWLDHKSHKASIACKDAERFASAIWMAAFSQQPPY